VSGRGLILELFGGPGGLSEGARMAGLEDVAHLVAIELDAAACSTRAAAGHRTIRADVSRYPADQLAGRVLAVTGSPVCTTFSAAGKRAGSAVLDVLAEAVRDQFAGRKTLARRRREMAAVLKKSGWPKKGAPRSASYRRMTRLFRVFAAGDGTVTIVRGRRTVTHSAPAPMDVIWAAVRSASLVVEPARFIAACRPEWVALEQVPDVLPLWKVYAEELRKLGYSAWCGILNAADYGVPQTRQRAILIASRTRTVRRPEPTHYDPRKGMQLWGTPWVSMAEALGWGATGRPVPTVTAGGTRTGGAEPFGHRDRDALEAERDAGAWALRRERSAGRAEFDAIRDRPLDAPAPTVSSGGEGRMSWVLHTNRDQRPDGTRQTADPQTAPAPALTAKSGGQWLLRMDTQAKATHPRPADEPAPTIQFAHRANLAAWVQERPSTTVQGDPRIGRPGHKDRDQGESQFAQDSVRITVEEAAALQSFPPGYPFQGSKTARFTQIGNAVPPLLAAHIFAEAAGMASSEAVA
jgi:DNA (cytosine-5)-methyltransferase 1